MRTKISLIAGFVAAIVCAGLTSAQDESAKSPEDQFREAMTASQGQDYDKAVTILRELHKERPDNPLIHFHLGYNLHAAGNHDEALSFHEKAAKSDQFKPTALYNIACVYSLKDDKDKAFDFLKQSIDAGFRSLETMKTDSDLDNIRQDDRFAEMVALVENDGKAPEKKFAKEDLYGTWEVVSGSRAGNSIASDRLPTIKITKETFTIPAGPDKFVMSYKVDMDAKPWTVDFKIESGPVPEGKAKGILKFKDEKLTLCYHPEDGDRPEKFISTEENGFFMFKMKKKMEATQVKAENKDLAKAIIGKWKCVKGTRAGENIAAERMSSTITIDEKLITIPVGEDQAFEMSYKIDDSKSPATIDMQIEAGPAPPGGALGIIEMKDGKLMLCYDPNDQERPEKFASSDSDGFFLFEMEPAKE